MFTLDYDRLMGDPYLLIAERRGYWHAVVAIISNVP